MTTETQGTVAIVTVAIVLARVVEKLAAGLLSRRSDGNGHKVDQAVVVAKLDAIKEDTERIRSYCHDIINTQAGVKGATELLINRLEHCDKRR